MRAQPSQPLPDVSISSLADLLSKAGSVRLIDLRPRDAFEAAHLPGSSRLAPEELDKPFLRPPRRRPVVLVAETADEAREAARRLISAGYTATALNAPVSFWPGPWESGPERKPAWEPSPLVGRWAEHLPQGRVVDLACGSGRDAAYLAMRGAEVTGIDILPDAIEQAAFLAARHGVSIDLRVGDVENDPGCWDGAWGTIHVHRFLHRPVFPLITERLREGGLLLYETFLEEQARTGRRPQNPAHLLKAGELRELVRGLQVIDYREGQTEDGDWTASLVARKGAEDEV